MSQNQKPLFSLNGVNFSTLSCPLAYGTDMQYRGKPFSEHLQSLGRQIEQYTLETNNGWERFKSLGYRGETYLNGLLIQSTWAYAQSMDISDMVRPSGGVLYNAYIGTLERLCLTSFIVVHTYGSEHQQMIALRGILTDFVCNGGMNNVECLVGKCAKFTLEQYGAIHFGILEPLPMVAEAYVRLISGLAKEIQANYPLTCLVAFDSLQRATLSELRDLYPGSHAYHDFGLLAHVIRCYIDELLEKSS